MANHKLTELAVKRAKPKDKQYKLTDGGGLYLLCKPNGSRLWQMAYRFAGLQKTYSIGAYPAISLAAAREAANDARLILAKNLDPSKQKQLARLAIQQSQINTLEALAREWWEHNHQTWTPNHADRIMGMFEADVFRYIGLVPVAELTAQQVKAVVRHIEKRDALDVAGRVLQNIKRVMAYAVECNVITVNIIRDLKAKARQTTHRAALPPEQLPAFVRDVSQYSKTGSPITQYALELLLLTFVRSQELRFARWRDFDVEGRIWKIPAEHMKKKTEHFVYLADQTLAVLEKLRPLTGHGELLFPSEKNFKQPMSDGTLRMAIFRMGYDGTKLGKAKCVPHGLRSTACSILNEQGFNPDAIERQMSHMERNGVRAAYIHQAQYKDERIKMMEWWAKTASI